MTWDEMKTKYPEYRDQMSEEREDAHQFDTHYSKGISFLLYGREE